MSRPNIEMLQADLAAAVANMANAAHELEVAEAALMFAEESLEEIESQLALAYEQEESNNE